MKSNKNINYIAEQAGVSAATVSRALNGTGTVREITRQRILQIAHEIDYWGTRQSGKEDESYIKVIGVILPELIDEFYTKLIRGIDIEAHNANCRILVSSSHSSMSYVRRILQIMGSGQVDGLILMAPIIHDEVLTSLEKLPIPLVFLNSGMNFDKYSSINIDNCQGAFAATEHLIEHGYKKIGIIQGPEGNCDAAERFKGFCDALEKSDLHLIQELVAQQNFSQEGGYYGFTRLMSQQEKPDAIFCSNDMMAMGAMEAAKAMKIKIPEDVAICGFDNLYFGHLVHPKLTTVHIPISEIGAKAVNHLLKIMSAKPTTQEIMRETVSTGLIVRESCGCKKA